MENFYLGIPSGSFWSGAATYTSGKLDFNAFDFEVTCPDVNRESGTSIPYAGSIMLNAGNGVTTGHAGDVEITAGNGGSSDGIPGLVTLKAGRGGGNRSGGDVYIGAGNGSGTGRMGEVFMQAGGDADSSSSGTGKGGRMALFAGWGGKTSGDGGDVEIGAADARGGDSSGGSVYLSTGDGVGTGTKGKISCIASVDIDNNYELRLPNRSSAPTTLTNGMVWMESDGLHIYYNGAEKVVAGA
jgi:hypothetical protein